MRTSREQKCLFIFSCADFTASFDSDKVLSAGDMGCNLFMFNGTISEDLSNKSAKSTHTPDIHPPPCLAIIFCEGNLRLRKFYVFQAAHRGWLHGYSLAIHIICFVLLCLKPPCDDNMTALDFILVPAGLWTLVCFQRSVDQHFYFLFFAQISGSWDKICKILQA